MTGDVSSLVQLATLNLGSGECPANRTGQGFRAIDDAQIALLRLQSAAYQLLKQRFRHRRILRRALPQSEAMFLSLAIHTNRDDHAWAAAFDSIDEQDAQIQFPDITAHQL